MLLSRVGAQLTLVERSERPSEVGAALALQANGMAVLDRLGLLGRVAAESARIDRMDIRTATGRLLLSSAIAGFRRRTRSCPRCPAHGAASPAARGGDEFGWGGNALRVQGCPGRCGRVGDAGRFESEGGASDPARRLGGRRRRRRIRGARYGRLCQQSLPGQHVRPHADSRPPQRSVGGVLDAVGFLRSRPIGRRHDVRLGGCRRCSCAGCRDPPRSSGLCSGVGRDPSSCCGTRQSCVLRRPIDQHRPPSRLPWLVLWPVGLAR